VKKLGDLQREEARAMRALSAGEWWNGRTWRPRGTHPRTSAEAAGYQEALDRLGEILDAMVGGTEAEQLRKAKNFSQSSNALHKQDSRREHGSYVWEVLAERFTEARLLSGPLTNAFLDEYVEELERGRLKTRAGGDWFRGAVKSFLVSQRRKRRL
jgi:hypothetical protein